jgi:hypothetical protein
MGLGLAASLVIQAPALRAQVNFAPTRNIPVGLYPGTVLTGDLDGDGDLAVVAATQDSDDVSILINNGDATFAPARFVAVGDSQRPSPWAIWISLRPTASPTT